MRDRSGIWVSVDSALFVDPYYLGHLAGQAGLPAEPIRQALMDACQDPSAGLRATTVWALVGWAEQDAAGIAQALTTDADARVRAAAAQTSEWIDLRQQARREDGPDEPDLPDDLPVLWDDLPFPDRDEPLP